MASTSSYPLPRSTPVFLTRIGRDRRLVVVAVLDEGPFGDQAEAQISCDTWRIRVGRWISKSSAARKLGIGVKRVDALVAEGRLTGFTIGTNAAVDYDTVVDECNRRAQSDDPRLNPLPQ